VVWLVGAAGAGKTRLLTEASLLVQLGDGRFLRGQCREQISLPYQPLDDVLATLLRELPTAIRATLPVELAQILPDAGPDVPANIQSGTGHASHDQAEARLRLFAACAEILQQATQTRPCLIAVEDLQWADPTTLELLGYLVHRLDRTRILLVLTYRPEEVEPGTPLSTLHHNLQRDRLGHTITLDLLTHDQVANFLRTALGRDHIPAWLVDSFHQATDGNPLFIAETLKTLAAEGQVAQWAGQESSQWRNLPSAILQLPQSVLSLAERRLQLLSSADRPILTAAAVLGPEFSFALLKGVVRLDEDALLDAIDRLLATHLIEELPLQNGEDRYRFTQEALRQALLTAISRRRLRSLHRHTGETIQAVYGSDQPRYWPVLAYHFVEAGDENRGLKYYTLAGDAAARVYANAEAAAHYNHALELVHARLKRDEAVESEQLIYLYTRRGLSLGYDGQYEAAWRSYEEMEQLAQERDDRALELATLLAQARLRVIPTPLHDFEQAEILSQQALALAGTLGDRQAEAKALENLLSACSLTGRMPQAIAYGEQSLAIARELDDPEQIAFTLIALENAYVATGQVGRALAALLEAAEIWRSTGNTFMLAISLSVVSIRYYLTADFDRSHAVAEEALRLGESTGNPWAQSYSGWALALIHMEQGRPDKMIEAMEKVIHLGDQAGLIPVQVFSRAELAWTMGELGALEQGLELVHLARTTAEELLPDWRLFPIVVMASLRLRQGDLSAAKAALEEAESIPRTEPNSAMLADIWVALIEGELALAKEDYDQVIAGMDRFVAHLQRTEIRSFICEGLLLKGQALLAQGRVEEAYEVLTETCVKSEAAGSRRVLWPVLATLSQVERQRGHPTEAEHLRHQAREIIEYIAGHSPPDLRASLLALPVVRAVLGDP
jgi:predicted ATPase